jgi:diguanylate cyclase (GGDEF)-like protein/PAS domain S-box-containing protein
MAAVPPSAGSRLSLAARLIAVAVAIVSLAAIAILVSATQRAADYLRADIESQVQAELATQLRTIADFVVVGDLATMETVFTDVVAHPSIARVTWISEEGGSIDVDGGIETPTAPGWFVAWADLSAPTVTASLVIGGVKYGDLTLVGSTAAGSDRLWRGFLDNLAWFAAALVMQILAIVIVVRRGLRPLAALAAGARRFGSGDFAARIEAQGSPEMRQTIASFNGMAEELGQMVHALHESRENLAITLQSIGDAVIVTDRQGCVTSMNAVAERLTAWTEVEAHGRPLGDAFPIVNALTREPAFDPVAHVLATGLVVGLANHTTLLARDGREYQIADSAAPIRDRHGELIGVVLVFRDVTEEYALREQVNDNERRFRALFEQAAVGMAQVERGTGRLAHVNRRFAAILDYPVAELDGLSLEFLTHDSDVAAMLEACRRLAAGEVAEHGAEWRLLRRDGAVVWVDATLSVMAVDDRRGDSDILVIHDITQSKRDAEELRIAATAFEAEEAMVVCAADETILRVNRAFSLMTGYAAGEVVGRTPRILKSGRHDADFYRHMWETLKRDKFWQGELWNRRRNGEIFPVWQTISAVQAPDGSISHYVGAFTDISERKEAEEQIRNLAYYDPLTQLPNRRLLMERLELAMMASARNRRHGALLFIDLDYFKILNDTEGHDVGDLLLVEVAQRLRRCVREGDMVARLGGDEFVVMLDDLHEETAEAMRQAEVVGEKIREVVAQPHRLRDRDYHGTLSLGISLFRDHHETIDELLKRADVAMYQAKADGRNTLRFFDPQMQQALVARAALEDELRRVLASKQLVLYFQPQIDHQDRVLGAEVLLRWQHPERGLVSPAEFIPLAEETGLILPIGHWVLAEACRQLGQWRDDPATSELVLAVNVSARQFRQADFVNQVHGLVTDNGVDPARLKLELTESVVLDDVADTIDKMRALKDLGVGFAMDDFGTGYSSLSYLRRLPLDQLKIDRSFIRDVDSNSGDAVIVQTIIGMAASLGLKVIAEGVENESQRAFLNRHGCPTFQGFLFSRPVPLSAFEQLLN